MSAIEIELEEFLQKTKNPSAWLIVVAAKAEIERLNRELKLAKSGWRSGDANDFLSANQNANNALDIKK